MDLSAIAWLNLPVFGFYFLGCYFPKKKEILSQLIRFLFILVNMTGLAINVLDIAYFRFRKQRSNINLWYVWSDSMVSVKSMVTGFWPLIILFLLLAALLVWRFLRTGGSAMLRMMNAKPPNEGDVRRAHGHP